MDSILSTLQATTARPSLATEAAAATRHEYLSGRLKAREHLVEVNLAAMHRSAYATLAGLLLKTSVPDGRDETPCGQALDRVGMWSATTPNAATSGARQVRVTCAWACRPQGKETVPPFLQTTRDRARSARIRR